MMMKKYVALAIGVFCGWFLAGQSAAETTTFKIAALSPDGSVWMKSLRAGGKEVEARTEGRVKFKFYPGGVMGDDKAVLRKIRVGQLQGAILTSGGLLPAYSDIQLYSLPMVFRNANEVAHIRGLLDDRLEQGLRENAGFVSFGIAEVGFAYAMTKAPVVTVAQMREQRVWSPDNDPGAASALEAFSIAPIPLSIADVLTGLQTGLVNAVAVPPVGAIALQWHTQLTDVMDVPLMYVYGLLSVTEKQFGKLSEADQQVVNEVMRKVVQAVDAGARKDNASARNALADQGLRFTAPDTQALEEWHRFADEASQRLVDGGFVSAELFRDMHQALDSYRAAAGASGN